ncbi:MAG: MMPL family transporter, partial [Thermodesulfobacteriota bacterium]|nr:MMPL family transporter [Thermodesulfobacteriota bacterium]
MTKTRARKLDSALAWWVDTIRRSAYWVMILAIISTVAIFYYTVNNLGISTDTADMLSESLNFRRLFKDYVEAFPQYHNTLLIVIDGETPDLAHDAATALANRLRLETGLFKSVYLPGGGKFFEKHGLLYLSPSELDDLTDSLARAQPFLARLSADQSLRGIFSMLRSAIEADINKGDLELGSFFERLSAAIEASLNKGRYEISWLELMQGEGSTLDKRRRLIIAQPQLDYTKLLPGKTAIKTVRDIAQKLHLKSDQGIRVRITGSVALEYEELISVSRGALIAGLLALILVGLVLFAGLGSLRLVLSTLVTLIMGLIWTAGFATVAVGHLNLISVAFAVLYIGLGVDYAIHFCLRYKELIEEGNSHSTALRGTAQNIGGSLVLCSFTTAIGFYAFIPTIFAGIAELGVISGTGMFIGLIANLTVLPALLTLTPLSPKPVNGKKRSISPVAVLFTLPLRHFVAIRIGALTLGLGSLFLLPHATFDRNTLNLRDPESESVSTFTELLSQSWNAPWSLKILSPDLDAAGEYAERLNELDLVYRAITLKDFVPTKQDIKLASLEDISLILGPYLIERKPQPSPSTQDQISSMQSFLLSLERFLEKK